MLYYYYIYIYIYNIYNLYIPSYILFIHDDTNKCNVIVNTCYIYTIKYTHTYI